MDVSYTEVGITDRVISGTLQNMPNSPKEPVRSRDGNVFISQLIDAYMLAYQGKDESRPQRMRWWQDKIGRLTLNQIEDDHIFFAVDELSKQRGRYYKGLDANGNKIYKAKNKPLAPATLNRYVATIGALFTWAIKSRIAPKGWVHPCRGIDRRPENNERVRFLNDSELDSLMTTIKSSSWKKLYLMVLLGITTGARKGELKRLKWKDIDMEKRVAYTGITKNGDRKTTALLPKVIDELKKYQSQANQYIFASERIPTQPYSFDKVWLKAVQEAKIKDFHFHDLRHSCASYLVQNHATLVEVADVLGHRDLRTTRRYAHLGTEHKSNLVNRVLGHIQ